MKPTKSLLAVIAALTALGTANAATDINHITGSTAFRSAAITAIEDVLGGAGNYKCAWVNSSTSTTSEKNATYAIISGTLSGQPVIFKCSWGGSVGGLEMVTQNASVSLENLTGWLNSNNLPATNATVALTSGTLTSANWALDTALFPTETQYADTAFSDCHAASAGFSTSNITGAGTDGGKVGVIVFEWVTNNGATGQIKLTGSTTAGSSVITTGSTAGVTAGMLIGGPNLIMNTGSNTGETVVSVVPNTSITVTGTATASASSTYVIANNTLNPITNISGNQAQQALAGGIFLSQFTGNSADTEPVYIVGRSFDSGTRVSEMAETGYGIFEAVQQVQPYLAGTNTFTGLSSALQIGTIGLWPDESLFGTDYPAGASGYVGGGDVAGALAAYGSTTATDVGGINSTLLGGDCYLVGYLGRSDANTAVKKTVGANNAHRITFNGASDWSGPADATYADSVSGNNSVYNDNAIIEGTFPCWEYEFLYYKQADSTSQKAEVNAIAGDLYNNTNNDDQASGLGIGQLHVSKQIEGGVIAHK